MLGKYFHLSHAPTPFACILFLREGLTEFFQAGIKHTMCLPLPVEQLRSLAYTTMPVFLELSRLDL
jgi:hypothetical protein